MGMARSPHAPVAPSLVFEISQIRRWLILAGRHQLPITAQEIGVLAEHHVIVVLGAEELGPDRMVVGSVCMMSGLALSRYIFSLITVMLSRCSGMPTPRLRGPLMWRVSISSMS